MATKVGIQFIHDSEQAVMEEPLEVQGVPQPPLESACEDAIRVISLPPYEQLKLEQRDIWQVMQNRRTLRRYVQSPLSIDELTTLLWFSQGVKCITDRPVTMRTVPSGGARHPFDTYLIVNRVDGLDAGFYRYIALEHKLAFLKAGDQADQLNQKAVPQFHVKDCAVSFWWAVDTIRSTWRYSTRGYRYFMIDAGHVCQNLTLAAEALNCGVCAIGSFDDQAMNQFFGLDGKERFILYGATVGKK